MENQKRDVTVDEILNTFHKFSGVYEKEMVEAAIDHRTEIVPRLIDILQNILADPSPYLDDHDRFDHIYAFMLLGHLKATEAHRTIIDVFSLPGKNVEEIFGDLCFDDLPSALLRTSGGSLEQIKAMALNRQVRDYRRLAALQAMAYAVVEGLVDRETVLALFASLFTGDEADLHSDFWSILASNIINLYPEAYMDIIKKAFDDELITPGMIRLEDIEQSLKGGKEIALDSLRDEYERFSLEDIHARMSWWACFRKNDDTKPLPAPSQPILDPSFFPTPELGDPELSTPERPRKKKNPKDKKKKRKQAQVSKRKNRR